MRIEELDAVEAALDSKVVGSSLLAGGFSHETCLLTLVDGRVVARFGGADPAIEAAVMAVAGPHAPVPGVVSVLPGGDGQVRPAMVIEYVEGTVLSEVLAEGGLGRAEAVALGGEVGGCVAGVAAVSFGRRGFFAGDDLAVDGGGDTHGPRARRRQLLRPLRSVLVVELVLAAVVVPADLNPWLLAFPVVLVPVAIWIGLDRYDGLGHRLTEHHLVASEPKVGRRRNLLLRRGIIGWRVEQSLFQRRAGLVTLVATTAAGDKKYAVVDLTEDQATALAHEAVPGLVAQFVRSAS